MKCINCGSEISDDSIFCNFCGRPIREVAESDALEDEYLFAADDGIKEDRDDNPGSQRVIKSSGKKNMKPAVIVAAGLVLLFMVFSLLFLSGLFESDEDRYLKALEKTDIAISEKNFGEAEVYYEEAGKYFDEMSDTDNNDIYSLLQRNLSIRVGMNDDEGTAYVLENLINIAQTEGYLSDMREYYGMLLDCYDTNGEDVALGELIDKISHSDDKKLKALLDKYKPAPPVFTLPAGELHPGDKVSVDCEDGSVICYSSSGKKIKNKKKTKSNHDERELAGGENIIYAYCINGYGLKSSIATFTYVLDTVYHLPMPEVTPDSGEYTSEFQIEIYVPDGLTAYYSWNATPDENSTRYSLPISVIEGNNVLNVIYMDEYGNRSNVQRMNYIYMVDSDKTSDDSGDFDEAAADEASSDIEDNDAGDTEDMVVLFD